MNFLTDPIWSNTPSPVPLVGPRRWVAPGLDITSLPPIDFVVISHNHYDHLDLPTLKDLAGLRKETVFLVPTGNGQLLRDAGIE
ncbi:MAG: MBL fold metallo-hydrolase, partial [Pseudomonadales bacterium]